MLIAKTFKDLGIQADMLIVVWDDTEEDASLLGA
jgi:hypothetical protein